MKKIILNIFLLISLIIPFCVNAKVTSDAKELIDINKLVNLKLNYGYDDYKFNDINVKLYRIASITENFQYELEDPFKDYKINVNGIKTNSEWDNLKQTLESYIKADNILELENYLIQDNKVEIKNLKVGLYLIETEVINTENYTLSFSSHLIQLPDLNADGYWNYDIEIYPKSNVFTPKYEKVEYTVIKQWEDNKQDRPKSVEIEIYEDENLVFNETLSSENNWTYKWSTEDDGSIWSVVERNVPEGYHVTILNNERNFIVVNTNSNYEEKNPQTIDNINLYFYLLIGSFIGLILLVITLIVNKRKV